jgi:SprT protein
VNKEQLSDILKKYMPEQVVDYAAHYMLEHRILLRIAKPRKSINGNYMPPLGNGQHRISVNRDLNPYAFTITFFHEIAHLTNWNTHQQRVMAHGPEWKQEFQKVMTPVSSARVLPADVQTALDNYLQRPKASTCSDPNLLRTLRRYDKQNGQNLVEELPLGSLFRLQNGMVLRRGERRKTRFLCAEHLSGKQYLVHGLAICERIT